MTFLFLGISLSGNGKYLNSLERLYYSWLSGEHYKILNTKFGSAELFSSLFKIYFYFFFNHLNEYISENNFKAKLIVKY